MRRGIKWIAVPAALALVASACGSDDDDDTSSSEGTAAAEGSVADDGGGSGEEVTISIESWRTDDQAIWDDEIIPAFEAEFPNISVEFTPTPPADYNAALSTRLQGGTAGALITGRPCEISTYRGFVDSRRGRGPSVELDGAGAPASSTIPATPIATGAVSAPAGTSRDSSRNA